MSRFVIECPNCGKFAEAKTGFFARKKIDCSCGYTINVRTDKLTARKCPHCGNEVVFDQSQGAKAQCPVCHGPINTQAEQNKVVEFSCAQCGVRLQTSGAASTYVCPVCDHVNDIAERLKSEEIKKDGLASVIKYEGDNETLVWKHPIEDFNFGSQLIVHESQEAIFFRDGQALDLFGPGRYTLETQQLPLLEKLYKLPTDTEGTFHSEVYFINKAVQMAIKWGTPDKIRFIDPLTSAPLEIGASGALNLQVENSRKLIVKLVGTQKGIAWDDRENFTRSVQSSFRPLIANTVKQYLPAIIKEQQIDLLEIDERVNEISALLHEKLQPGFEEYGLTLPQFYVTHVVLPEEDPNFKRIRELHMYDVLRADRCISVNSLEARVPFGDLDFVQYVMSIDPAKKCNVYGKGKYLLRHAFEGDWLPHDILMREKAAFSDAVGHSMVDDLKAYAEETYTDIAFDILRRKYDFAQPFTKESLLYRELFERYYPDQARMVSGFWMPNTRNVSLRRQFPVRSSLRLSPRAITASITFTSVIMILRNMRNVF